MADSNQFHATCLDTYPPVFYLNDVSRRIIGLVHAINGEAPPPGAPMGAAPPTPAVVAAYTFDAGPNAVIFTTHAHAAAVLAVLLDHFPPPPAAAEDGCVCGAAVPACRTHGGATLSREARPRAEPSMGEWARRRGAP